MNWKHAQNAVITALEAQGGKTMNARVKTKDRLSKRQIEELTKVATEEYQKHSSDHAEGVARRLVKLFAQAMYETYGWTANGFSKVIDRVMELDKSADQTTDFMSHIDQNLKRLGYNMEPEDPSKWVIK